MNVIKNEMQDRKEEKILRLNNLIIEATNFLHFDTSDRISNST